MITEQELKRFEANCVNIGYSMGQVEVRELIKDCKSKEELEILIKRVWKRQDS